MQWQRSEKEKEVIPIIPRIKARARFIVEFVFRKTQIAVIKKITLVTAFKGSD